MQNSPPRHRPALSENVEYSDFLYPKKRARLRRTSIYRTDHLNEERGSGRAIQHSAARGGELVHLMSSIYLVCVVQRTSETRQPRAQIDRL